MLRGCAAAIVILCLAMTASAGAAPRGGMASAEQRYHACMDEVGSDAGQASRMAEEWRRQGGGDAARHCAAAADLALGRFAEAGEGLEALARDGSRDSPILRASLAARFAEAEDLLATG